LTATGKSSTSVRAGAGTDLVWPGANGDNKAKSNEIDRKYLDTGPPETVLNLGRDSFRTVKTDFLAVELFAASPQHSAVRLA
jgi:hypothetical protein